ncbi:MAG: DUF2339 domain-containing protein, partial [Pseudomonadota bacterium]
IDDLEKTVSQVARRLKEAETAAPGRQAQAAPQASVDEVAAIEPEDAPPPVEAPPTVVAETPVETPKSPARPNHVAHFARWLQANWVLAAGAVSLALAGVFLVQYGAEQGLLTPRARVFAALAFGALLLAGGEYLRRRFGDEADTAVRFVPSALSGAGFLTLFAAILSARALYDLIGPTQAFAGLAVVSTLSVLFGWFYGPVLSAIGVIGAIAAPYLVGGDTDSPWLLHYYFTTIAIAALAIDSFKRWAWLSVIALVGAGGSIWLIYLLSGHAQHFLAVSLALAAAALIIPERQFRPRLDGPPVSALAFGIRTQGFPTWLGFAVTVNAVVAACLVALFGNVAETVLAFATLSLIFVAAVFWLSRAPALADFAALPAVGFIALVGLLPPFGDLYRDFIAPLEPEQAPPMTVRILAAMALAATAATLLRLRGARDGTEALLWSVGGALFAPVVVFLLEFLWTPAVQYGDFGWALTVILVAAAMTVLAERCLSATLAEPKLHASLYAAGAIALIGLALFLLLTKSALTLALAVAVLLVVLLDRRFDLPLLAYVVKAGLLVITYRAVIDPGIFWAGRSTVSLVDVLLSYAGAGAVLVAAWVVGRDDRNTQRVSIECAVWVLLATLIVVLFDRLLPGDGLDSHWGLGMLAALWLFIAVTQLREVVGAGRFERVLRYGLAGSLVLFAGVAIGFLFTEANPLLSRGETVRGVPFLSTLALAYLPLAAAAAVAGQWLRPLWSKAPFAGGCAALALVAWYIALSIRHLWQGPVLAQPGVSDPELYSYTVAMLIGSAATLALAFWRRNRWLRTAAMVGVGITVAKVFLIDMAGLTGLVRVLSFMGLGLSLLALTWLNRLMDAQWGREAAGDQPT